ncbi:MAG: excinuclease ABC subunit UvrC [bacterium]
MTKKLAKQINEAPHKPGVYLYYDRHGHVLYVGKAKNLQKRIQSYFQRTKDLTPEKQILVKSISQVETIITSSEVEALLLEATLIKRHQPKHNIVLRDDKNFLYVRILLDDHYPSVALVRRIEKDKAKYYGPYTSARSLRMTMKMLRKIFPYRTCVNPADKPCFDSQLGKCAGHDLNPNSREEYQRVIKGLMHFLEGHGKELVRELKDEMKLASQAKQFELAAQYRDRLHSVLTVLGEQKVISPKGENEDVVSLARNNEVTQVHLFRIRQGKVIGREEFTMANTKDLDDSKVVAAFLEQYYAQTTDYPKSVLIPVMPDSGSNIENSLQLRLVVPVRGKKKKLLKLGEENALNALEHSQSLNELEKRRRQKALLELARALGIKKFLSRIEAYDISNIQGINPVGSMVVMEEGLPKKSDYRKFSIRDVQGPDDFRMLAEVIGRRLKHPDWPKPDLIILDGGKGQLSTVLVNVKTKIPIVALAKKQEEIFTPGKSESIRLPKDSEVLFLIQRIRDEAHRFALGYYRKRHEGELIKSKFDEISGIGPKTKKLLLARYGSVSAVRKADYDDLTKLIGSKKTNILREFL